MYTHMPIPEFCDANTHADARVLCTYMPILEFTEVHTYVQLPEFSGAHTQCRYQSSLMYTHMPIPGFSDVDTHTCQFSDVHTHTDS